ncbi:hypothetical protein LWI28_022413 [Acer negundo]|uniref:Uncharacterized protein n=1 Tax=Acer negundo TaxID=4023 RepID=A0AAD5IS74_ACENE|nr:hypothetical protein LWI28_022413 [Acer negundo]
MESKGLPIEPEVSFTLDSTAEKAVKEVVEETSPFEDVQELPDENLEVEVVEDPPEEKRSEETNLPPSKPSPLQSSTAANEKVVTFFTEKGKTKRILSGQKLNGGLSLAQASNGPVDLQPKLVSLAQASNGPVDLQPKLARDVNNSGTQRKEESRENQTYNSIVEDGDRFSTDRALKDPSDPRRGTVPPSSSLSRMKPDG